MNEGASTRDGGRTTTRARWRRRLAVMAAAWVVMSGVSGWAVSRSWAPVTADAPSGAGEVATRLGNFTTIAQLPLWWANYRGRVLVMSSPTTAYLISGAGWAVWAGVAGVGPAGGQSVCPARA